MKAPTLKHGRCTVLTILTIARVLEVPHGSKYHSVKNTNKKSKIQTQSIQNNLIATTCKCMLNLIDSELYFNKDCMGIFLDFYFSLTKQK